MLFRSNLGRDWIGIEQDAEWCRKIETRLEQAESMPADVSLPFEATP